MTNEQAIKELKLMLTDNSNTGAMYNALKLAIKALETHDKRTETHACDLISRQAAIDALNKKKIYRPLDSDRWVISDCLNAIVNLPSVQPEHDLEGYLLSGEEERGEDE